MVMKSLIFTMLQSSSTDQARKKNTTDTDISSVPYPILAEILSRIPARTVFCCMAVSKLWLSVIDDSLFKLQHFLRARACPMLIFDSTYSENEPSRIVMNLVEGESLFDLDPQFGNHKLISRVEISPTEEVVPRTGTRSGTLRRLNFKATSCEGLICSSLRHCRGGRDHVIVCNPVTGESVKISLFDSRGEDDRVGFFSVFIGLGFSRVDNKFKLLRVSLISEDDDGEDQERVGQETYLLEHRIVGTKGWNSIQVPFMPSMNFRRKVDDVVYVNGVIYWSYLGDNSICCFSFDADEFQVVPLPEMNGVAVEVNSFVTTNMHMGVLRDSLCVSFICPDDGHVELWMIEKNSGSRTGWRKILNFETEATAMEHSGCLSPRGYYKPIKYLECGKILLHDWHETFLIYDPVTKIERMFRAYLEGIGPGSNLQVVSHVPSLIPLKTSLNMEVANIQKPETNNQKPHHLYTFL